MFEVGQRVRRTKPHDQLDKGAIVFVVRVGMSTIDVSRAKGGPPIKVVSGARAMHFSSEFFEAVDQVSSDRRLLLC